MTEQVPDICVYDGREWVVEESDDFYQCIPTNEELGFTTTSTSTANWSGRIDHYLVFKDQLYLFKVEVNLPDDQLDLVPAGVRREVRYLYEPRKRTSDHGMIDYVQVHERRFFIYDDLKIDYSGELVLSYPTGDVWDYPWPLNEDDIEPCSEATLRFCQGRLENTGYFSAND